MSDGKPGGRFFDRVLTVNMDREKITQGLTTLVAIGGIFAAAGAAVLLIGLATDLVDSSGVALGDADDPTGGRFYITDAHIQTDEAGRSVLREFVSVGPGASPLNLSQIVIQISDGHQNATLVAAQEAGEGTFSFRAIRDKDGSVEHPSSTMGPRDLVQIDVDLSANGITPRGGTSLHHVQRFAQREPTPETVLIIPTDVRAPSLVNLEVVV